MEDVRYVAIGDSFTEGVGDELPDGGLRGWADIAAQGWANASGRSVSYANLAIRGKLAWPIVAAQLEPALALKPTHLSFNGGGNDMLRPRADMERIADAFTHVRERCAEEGVTFILLSGANPSGQLPMGRLIQRRGDELSEAVLRRFASDSEVVRVLNWPDRKLARPQFWSADRLHMNSFGHHRVAARLLRALGYEPPAEWWAPRETPSGGPRGAAYYRQFVGPWVRRRLTGTSSGDGRLAKHPDWVVRDPEL